MEVIQGKPIGEALAREPEFYTPTSRETHVSEADPTKYLRIALRLVGVAFIVGIYTFVNVWPSGWSWHAGQSHHLPHYLQMILGVYATLGVFLLIASRDPLAHRSLIWFTVWSSVVHGAVMAVQAVTHPQHMGHLWGDVPALFIVAGILAFLMPRGSAAVAQ